MPLYSPSSAASLTSSLGATNMTSNGRYAPNSASQVVLTLPTAASVGATLEITGVGTGGWKVAQNASQVIHFGTGNTTAGTGGSLTSTATRDSIRMICVVANNEWNVVQSVGNITIT